MQSTAGVIEPLPELLGAGAGGADVVTSVAAGAANVAVLEGATPAQVSA